MNLIRRLLEIYFDLLYHPLAFTYDLVAAAVSFGKWKDWIFAVLPFITGTRILELGHGPGHLQRLLLDRGLSAFGIDESKQMSGIAKRRLGNIHKLARGLAQSLPYSAESFDAVVSTFPSEYIFDLKTLSEAKRVLRSGGRLIVLPVAFPKNGFLKWFYKVTGESPEALTESLKTKLLEPFTRSGFHTELRIIELKSVILLALIAERRNHVKKITRTR